MKKIILISCLFLSFFFFSNTTKAGTVTIDTTSQFQPAGPCNFNQGVRIILRGTAVGYPASDTIMVQIAFGDGSFGNTIGIVDTSDNFSAFFSHSYSSAGLYTLQFIATASDAAADTLVIPNAIIYSDTCGNINGQVYLDQNNDCSFNGSDEAIYGKRVNAIQGGIIIASDWTDSSGNYSILVPSAATYTIEIDNNNNGYSYNCPVGGIHTVSSIPSTGNDFALDCNVGFDLFGNVHGGSVPGQIRNLYANTYNSYCQDQNGTVKIVFTDSLFSYSGTAGIPPSAINGDTVEWNFTNLNNNGFNSFNVSIGTYTDTTAQIGDTVCVTYIVEPNLGDSNAANNIKQFCFPVRTSYDPNIKQVQPIGASDSGRVLPNTDLTYTIHFQNTGTAQAYNIYILDTLDTSVLNTNTIQVLGSSDDVVVNLISPSQNVIKFRFDNINLPDSNTNEPASHGWVTYTIEQQPSLSTGQTIRNSAAIYFDYNPPIITNSTINTIDGRLVGVQSIGNQSASFAKIYPNPANNIINIEYNSSNEPTQINLMNINGQLVRQINSVNQGQQIDVSGLNSGIYLLELRKQNGQRQLNKIVISN